MTRIALTTFSGCLKGINAIKGVKGIKVAAFQKKFFLLFLLFLRENLLILRLENFIP